MWVFGYGSLMWNPGFEAREKVLATLRGYRRCFCMRSVHHRGTRDNPGLVLALDKNPNAECLGVALAVATGEEGRVLRYLRERELISSAYIEKRLDISLCDGRTVAAVTYVVDDRHEQYCGELDGECQARIISRAEGGRGPNDEYLYNTAEHLAGLGIIDGDIEWLVRRVRKLGNGRLAPLS
ncbi:MAG: gamma-glutamylcyclotransferase [Roseovarius sp.]|nr:gamma-glutamylcyclotransferase [Roseovarius sp.]